MIILLFAAYLKETPEATPLIPSGNSNLIGVITQYPLIFVIGLIVVLLLVMLLIGLLVITRVKRTRNAEAKR